ncbi:hypothetical protein TanjilG_28756 [Lupinus angustifolius]|uniref:Response regulatory domain-containing protein n=1 Tax=Lupinus angustifolius TaxID=3871 RepID=A0A1J7FM93_LUPAN|nr:PREDICTED: two-component response regulator ARR9-like isoform X1 [Lupinus angustifolius]OIV89067.1 hypothetical protein TanjilG_28756 [Lupinus angustifolius]
MGMAAAESQQYHVLAVDDSIIDRKLIERLLKTSSYQVTTVDSGSKALEFLGLQENDETKPITPCVSPKIHQDMEVNLVITDYCMPGMTGYDLLKKIKESSSLRNIPVVIMSSENVPSRITRCLEEGADEFFLKPVRKSDLNRLEPHIKRTKLKDQKQETLQKVENIEQQQILQPESETIIEQQHQQSLQQGNNNKRKTIEQGLSPDRTRPRYNSGIATVV